MSLDVFVRRRRMLRIVKPPDREEWSVAMTAIGDYSVPSGSKAHDSYAEARAELEA